MGLPIVLATPEGDASRFLADIGAGVWVPSEDPEALAGAIRALYADPSARERFAAGAGPRPLPTAASPARATRCKC